MSQLTIEIPRRLSQQVEARGLSRQQLGRVMTYLLDIYLNVEKDEEFIQIATIDEIQKNSYQLESACYNGEILSHPEKKQRKLGAGKWKGNIWMADDFDELPDDILNVFTGTDRRICFGDWRRKNQAI